MTWAFLLYGRPYGVVQGEAIMYLTNGKILVIIKNDVCVAQLDRALGYGPRCRGFESSHARWLTKRDRLDGLSFLIVRVRVCRSTTVGAKRMSTGHSAPSQAR